MADVHASARTTPLYPEGKIQLSPAPGDETGQRGIGVPAGYPGSPGRIPHRKD